LDCFPAIGTKAINTLASKKDIEGEIQWQALPVDKKRRADPPKRQSGCRQKLPDLKIRGERTPLEHLLALMNDSSLPPMKSQAIARRLAPYFHAKLKPISAGEG